MSDPTAHIEAVRRRPGMYVGDPDGDGLLNLAFDFIGNAFDQYLMGRCSRIVITVGADGVIEVEDDGPGIAADRLHAIFTSPSDQPTVDGHRPHAHLQGLVGIGLLSVNALCGWLEVTTVHAGLEASARYEVARGAPPRIAPSSRPPGTRVRFLPDPAIFPRGRISRMAMMARVDELTFLSPGLRIDVRLDGDATNRHGLAALVARHGACALANVAHGRAMLEGASPLEVEVAIAWCEPGPRYLPTPHIDSFVNYARSPEHGMHVNGMLDAICRFKGCDLQVAQRNLVAAVSVVLADVRWGNPAKHRLVNSDVAGRVEGVAYDALVAWAAAR